MSFDTPRSGTDASPALKEGMRMPTPEEKMKREFEELDKDLLASGNRKRGEYEKLRVKANVIFAKMELSVSDFDGNSKKGEYMKELAELYQEATIMRLEAFPQTMRRSLRIADGKSVEDTLTKPIDAVIDRIDAKSPARTTCNELRRIADALSIEPADLVTGQNPKNRYWVNFQGRLRINPFNITKDEQYVQSVEKSGITETYPELASVLAQLKTGLETIKNVDPMLMQTYAWREENKANFVNDTRPLRFLGLVAGSLLAGLGVYNTVVKGGKMTWPTIMWAAVAAYSLNPDMFTGAEKDAILTFEKLNKKENKSLIVKFDEATFEELGGTDAGMKKARALFIKTVTEKLKNDPTYALTNADVGILTDGKETPLGNTLKALSAAEAVKAVGLIGSAPKDDKVTMKDMIENKRDL